MPFTMDLMFRVSECREAGRHLSVMFPDGGDARPMCAHCRTELAFSGMLAESGYSYDDVYGQTSDLYEIWHSQVLEKESVNSYCAKLPRRRYAHESKGLVLLSPRTGICFVPFECTGDWCTVVVVKGTDAYQVGGYNLCVSDIEIETALLLDVVI